MAISISKLTFTFAFLAVCLLMDWRAVKQSSRATRWTTISIMTVSGLLWTYMWSNIDAPRAAVWLQSILDQFDPVS